MWLQGPKPLDLKRIKLPHNIVALRGDTALRLSQTVTKAIPNILRCGGGFSPEVNPAEVVAGKAQPMHNFTTERRHDPAVDDNASPEARARFEEDGRRFPPAAYEAGSLLWNGRAFRPYSPEEKAVIMGLPPSFTDPVKAIVKRPAAQIAARNSLVANSLHLPSFLLAMLVLVQLAHTKSPSLL